MKKILEVTGWLCILFGLWLLMGLFMFIDFKFATLDGQTFGYVVLPTKIVATKEFLILLTVSSTALGIFSVSLSSKY